MDYIEGVTVDQYFSGRPRQYADPAFLHITEQVIRALAYIHSGRFIHRDLKPQNIIIGSDCSPQLLDLGLALEVGSMNILVTRSGDFTGTFAYSSPEQLAGKKPEAGSDLYSVGLILYEFLTGQLPLWTENPIGTICLRPAREPVPVKQYDPAIPSPLSNMIIERDPSLHYHDSESLLAAWSNLRSMVEKGILSSEAAPPESQDVLTINAIETFLSEMPLLDTLDREERLRFAVFAAEHSFHAADCVFRQGDPGDALFIILKGCVKIRVDTDTGEEKTLNTLADGDIFGEMAIYTGDPRCANAYCIEDCRLLAIRKTDFDWLLSKNPTLSLKIVRLLSRKLANETKMFGRYESNG